MVDAEDDGSTSSTKVQQRTCMSARIYCTLPKGHVITARHEFCDVEKSDENLDNIVQISVTSQGRYMYIKARNNT